MTNNPFENFNVVENATESQNLFELNNGFPSDNLFQTSDFPFRNMNTFNNLTENVSSINVVVKVSLISTTDLELEADEKALLTTALNSELQIQGATIHHLEITDTRIDFTANLPTHLSVEKLVRNCEMKLQTVWLLEKRQSLLFDTARVSSVAIN